MKELKNYLHFYLPYNIKCKTPKGIGTMCTYAFDLFGFGMHPGFEEFMSDEVKPHFRPLSDITEDEAIELAKLNMWKQYGPHPHDRKYEAYRNSFKQVVVSWGEGLREKNVPECKEAFNPTEFQYLLSKHFDLFGLITEGLAIDKTTTTTNEKI